jgi:hypothetical protein
MMMNAQRADRIRELELSLLDPRVRTSKERLNELLADDFLEIGASGNRYSKQDVLELLPQEDATLRSAHQFEVREIAGDTVLVTFLVEAKNEVTGRTTRSLRSSIWKHRDDRWQMIFHQGTPLRE